MQYSLGQAEVVRRAALERGRSRRHYYRHKLFTLAYLKLDQANGGILCDLSQEGAAIQAVGELDENQTVHLRFDLPNPRLRVNVQAKVRWSNPFGQAGLQFLDLEPNLRRRVNQWIFLNLLSRISQDAPVWKTPNDRTEDDLILSADARPVIRLQTSPSARPAWPPLASPRRVPLSVRSLAKLMDALVLCCAVLLFFVVFLTVAHRLPPWPMVAGITGGVAVIFAIMYWAVFARLGNGTAGTRLAKLAVREQGTDAWEGEARFR